MFYSYIKKIKNLTVGELEVASMITAGLTYLETAKRIGKSINTVRGRIKSIYFKLGVENSVQLTNLHQALDTRFSAADFFWNIIKIILFLGW